MVDANYSLQKDLGLRKESGDLLLKQLSPKHKAICARFLRGERMVEIAAQLDMDYQTVARIVRDPLAQEYMENRLVDLDQEIKDRYRAMLLAIDRGLSADEPMVALHAANLVAKLGGEFDKGQKGSMSAEDVVAVLLAKIEAQNVTINVGVKDDSLRHRDSTVSSTHETGDTSRIRQGADVD